MNVHQIMVAVLINVPTLKGRFNAPVTMAMSLIVMEALVKVRRD